MVVTQGYDEWLAKDNRLKDTEECWAKMDRTELIEAIMKHRPETVVEFCCGTGWIPFHLPLQVDYLGIDKNEGCIELSRKRNPDGWRVFRHDDLLTLHKCKYMAKDSKVEVFYDMALAFSCLKHFTLEDLDLVYGKLLQACKKTLTTVYLRPEDVEETHHPYIHTAITMQHMERVIEENGHKLVQVFTLPPLNTMKEPLVLTERIDDGTDLVSTEGLRESGEGGQSVPLRSGLLGGVQEEAGDPSGESPDAGEGGDGEGSPGERSQEWPC
jgi:SAM-dependent methyltransferase